MEWKAGALLTIIIHGSGEVDFNGHQRPALLSNIYYIKSSYIIIGKHSSCFILEKSHGRPVGGL